jgi:hypothetical protein
MRGITKGASFLKCVGTRTLAIYSLEAADINPDFERGMVQQGKYLEAIRTLDKSIALNPSDYES